MKTFIIAVALAISTASVVACSGSSPATPDTLAYGQVASEVSSAVQTHRAASASFATQGDCIGERDRYDGHIAPLLERMRGLSGDMDACMDSMGHHPTPTLGDTCDAMRSELTRHMAAACASPNADAEASEANTHADRMAAWAKTEHDRSDEIGGMIHGSGCQKATR